MISDSGLHIIWTTYGAWPPQDIRGAWQELHTLYARIESEHFVAMSRPIHPRSRAAADLSSTVLLDQTEMQEIDSYLAELWRPDGDRIAGGLPVVSHCISSSAVQILVVPAFAPHGQIIGRLKSKTASPLLWSSKRRGEKHLWSQGYWFAELNDLESIEQVRRFIDAHETM